MALRNVIDRIRSFLSSSGPPRPAAPTEPSGPTATANLASPPKRPVHPAARTPGASISATPEERTRRRLRDERAFDDRNGSPYSGSRDGSTDTLLAMTAVRAVVDESDPHRGSGSHDHGGRRSQGDQDRFPSHHSSDWDSGTSRSSHSETGHSSSSSHDSGSRSSSHSSGSDSSSSYSSDSSSSSYDSGGSSF